MNELKFKSNGDGTCELVLPDDFAEEILYVPEKKNDGEKVISVNTHDNKSIKKIFLPATLKSENYLLFRLHELEEVVIAPENPYFSSFEGVIFSKDMTTLIRCPAKKSGKFVVPASVRTVAEFAFDNDNYCLEEIIFQEGLQRTEQYSLYGTKIVTLPTTLTDIGGIRGGTIIRAPKNSAAHHFAVEHHYKFMPTDCPVTWDADKWLKKFHAENADYRALRREVWENTRAIIEDNDYTLPNGIYVLLRYEYLKRSSQFYNKFFTAWSKWFRRQFNSPEITVVPDDCLDVAHKWVNDGLAVCVLNMANRRNPGGGVTTGAGAQEEYLFRCSDYYKFLYRYAPYAERYGVTRSHYQYPLDRDFGGIFSSGVTIFRENEATGYRLTDKPWKVNMIAVAGMNSPRLVIKNGEERIAPELVEGVKNKIRTIFRIAYDKGQKNLILGALGCGAFHNPPKHVAELFREILCEHEFFGAFQKICFAVKTSHTSKGNTNFSAFKEILDGFVPTLKLDSDKFENPVKKIVIGNGFYALLKTNGEVQIVDTYTGKPRSHCSRRLRKSIDISAGYYHLIGLRKDGKVIFKSVKPESQSYHDIYCYGGVAVDISACDCHSAIVKADGTVLCIDHPNDSPSGYPPTPEYSRIVESWRNIKQIALTYEMPFALTRDGKFLCESDDINEFFNACGKKIIQISAFGAYYTNHMVAALYADGTVKACDVFCDSYKALDEIESWNNVKKICCGHHVLIGLTNEGKILISSDFKYDGVETLENIIDIAEGGGFIALSSTGEII